MSGRRRGDDGWGDGRMDAPRDRGDNWADEGVGEWGGRDADGYDSGGRSRQSAGSGADGYGRGGSAPAYPAQNAPSFQAGGGSANGDRYARNGSDGGQRTAAGYATGAYSQDGYSDAGYGGQSAGYPQGGDGSGRRDAAGYDAGAYDANGYGGQPANANGYGGQPANGGGYGGTGFSPEFSPVEDDDPSGDGAGEMPRPYGRLSIYTLREDKTREFDRIAERAAEGVRTSEPDTLVYVIHVVPKAPQQRIIYEIYRDRAAFMSHERQPHIRQFSAERASCVLATNIIDLRLKYAKVAALGASPDADEQAAQPARGQRQEPAAPGIQYSPTSYSPAPQYAAAPAAAQAASFTPAGSDGSQYQQAGGQGYSSAAQYGGANPASYGAGNGQYDAANSNGYSGAAGYSNGAGYANNGYQASNGYQGANGYAGANGGQDANGYANGANGANGYNGYANSGNGNYGAGGAYPENGSASYGASASTQYTPRYRELTSGSSDRDGAGYADGGQQPEWDQRSQGYRQ